MFKTNTLKTKKTKDLSRRSFLKSTATVGVAGAALSVTPPMVS